MARTRELKPGFFKNEDLTELPAFARLLYAGLWTLADREGRLEDRAKRIKGEIFPYEDVPVAEYLASLEGLGFIKRYEADGVQLLWIPTFRTHQHPHPNEQESKYPPHPDDPKSETPQGDPMDIPTEHQGETDSGLAFRSSEPSDPSEPSMPSVPPSDGAAPLGAALAAKEYDPDWDEVREEAQNLYGLLPGHMVQEMRSYLEAVGLEWFRLGMKETREKANNPSWRHTKACLDSALAEHRPPGPRPKKQPRAAPGSARAQMLERMAMR